MKGGEVAADEGHGDSQGGKRLGKDVDARLRHYCEGWAGACSRAHTCAYVFVHPCVPCIEPATSPCAPCAGLARQRGTTCPASCHSSCKGEPAGLNPCHASPPLLQGLGCDLGLGLSHLQVENKLMSPLWILSEDTHVALCAPSMIRHIASYSNLYVVMCLRFCPAAEPDLHVHDPAAGQQRHAGCADVGPGRAPGGQGSRRSS